MSKGKYIVVSADNLPESPAGCRPGREDAGTSGKQVAPDESLPESPASCFPGREPAGTSGELSPRTTAFSESPASCFPGREPLGISGNLFPRTRACRNLRQAQISDDSRVEIFDDLSSRTTKE